MASINWHINSEYYICKRLRMLEHLKNKGFLPVRTEPDIKNPRYSVWIFKNSIELSEAIDEYLYKQANRWYESKEGSKKITPSFNFVIKV